MAKKWYKSKMHWFNIGMFLTTAGVQLAPIVELMSDENKAKYTPLLVVAQSVGNLINIYLRSITKQPVTL